jgi:hypothetical protein
MQDYEKEYEDFWKEIVEKDGVINIDQVKRELSDFSKVIGNVAKVYDHITSGRVSKPLTDSDAVIALHDDIRTKDINDAIEEYEKTRLE